MVLTLRLTGLERAALRDRADDEQIASELRRLTGETDDD